MQISSDERMIAKAIVIAKGVTFRMSHATPPPARTSMRRMAAPEARPGYISCAFHATTAISASAATVTRTMSNQGIGRVSTGPRGTSATPELPTVEDGVDVYPSGWLAYLSTPITAISIKYVVKVCL
jgi:hypothetical protein